MAFAITEPDAGSNSHNISTTATRDGDVYRLRGTKYYISGVDESEAVLVVTRTGVDPDTGRGRLSLFVVDTRQPRARQDAHPGRDRRPRRSSSPCSSTTSRSPADRLIGTEGDGLRQVFVGLNPERIMTAAIANGIGRYALDKAAAYAREPVGVGHARSAGTRASPIPWPRPRSRSSWPASCAEKAAWPCDGDGDPAMAGEAANMAKYAAAEAALGALDQAIQTHGGNGMSSEYGLADMWGMARLMRTAPVSREMILNFVAQHSLQLPKSY